MSLRAKIILVLSAVVALWATVDNVLLKVLVRKHFDALTRREVLEGVQEAVDRIAIDVDGLRDTTQGIATAPRVRQAVAGGDRATLAEALDHDALVKSGLDMLIVLGPDLQVLRYFARDAEGHDVDLRGFPRQAIFSAHSLLRWSEKERSGSILSTEYGLMLACSCVVPLDGSVPDDLTVVQPTPGPGQGAILVGRYLDPGHLETEKAGQVVAARLVDLSRVQPDEAQRSQLAVLDSSAEPIAVRDADGGRLVGFRRLEDVDGRPSVLLQVSVARDALAQGQRVGQFLVLSTLGTSILIFLVLLRLLQATVVGPLSRLTSHVFEIGRTDDTSRRIEMDRQDEIGQLSSEFDGMLDKLEESRRLLVATARQAGMSEIATGVLHNVGNVLNSVNVSARLVERNLGDMALRDLERVVEVLESNQGDLGKFITEDARGRNLLSFLNELAKTLASQRREVLAETERLRTGVDHVADLVRSQQALAGGRGVSELVALDRQLDEALKFCVQAYGRDGDLEIVREIAPGLPRVRVDRHKLMEILINLIQNAKQSMREAGIEHPRIVLRAMPGSEGMVRIEVEDNGAGIREEDRTRIFSHGFTTKKDGHGFGLHVSANAATEMGGTLQARSGGPGTGATFELEFPIDEGHRSRAA